MRDAAAEIKDRLTDRLEEVVAHFWPGAVTRGAVIHPCPGHHGDLGSFQVIASPRGRHERGTWFRNSQGIGGDVLSLFAYGLTGDVRATARVFAAAREFVGVASGRPETAQERAARERRAKEAEAAKARREDEARLDMAERKRLAGMILRECVPLAGTHGADYLVERGIPRPPDGWPERLRFHRGLGHPTGRRFPAIVARVDNVAGIGIGIWRIYLDPTALRKAPVEYAKLGLGEALGGAARLGPASETIAVAEGVETAMAVAAMLGHSVSVWAGLSTSGVAGLQLPPEVKRVRIFPDGDKPYRKDNGEFVPDEPPGRRAARKLWERLSDAGITATVEQEPPAGLDYLNLWNEMRGAA